MAGEARMRDPKPQNLTDWLAEIGRRLNRPFTELETDQFLAYFQLLKEWNENVNLTAIVDDEGIAIRHLLDSLSLLPYLDRQESSGPGHGPSLIDVGSGAGFPGLPLKIVRPDLKVTLLDSLAKRIRFLDAVIRELCLAGITAVHRRAEEAARLTGGREKFDIATARAVASLPALCEYCLPFVRVGGIFLAMRGPAESDHGEASRAIRLLGGELADIDEFSLPGTAMGRRIFLIRKIRPTPEAYPRKAGSPEKAPLI
jgi:16S rRNA (guanine527-N7)-methyltransferase